MYQRSQGAQGEKATDPKQPRLALAVAVPGPFRGPLTYGLDGQPPPPPPGSRVRVPLGARSVLGIALETLPEPTDRALKPISECLDPAPLLDPTQLALGRWLAHYYHAPLGEALRLFLPPEARRQEQATQARTDALRLTAEGSALLAALGADQMPTALRRAPAQQAALRALGAGPQRRAELLAAGHTAPTLRTLLQKGWVEPCDANVPGARAPAPKLHPEQAAAVAALTNDLGAFRATLLQGITGSGKTEVYLRVIEKVLAAGQQALVLVPEIGLTPQTAQRLAARLGAPVHTLHSSMAPGLRNQRWEAGRSGVPMVLLGTRSSLFAPLPKLGLIVVDEEHDDSYKQQDGVRYSARDVAVKRASLQGCPVVLGSATPALETLENARQGRYGHLRLRHRAGQAQAPRQRFVDLRKHGAPEGFPAHPRRHHRDPVPGCPGADLSQPPGLRPSPALPRLWLAGGLRSLRCPHDRAPGPREATLPSLRAQPAHPWRLPQLRRAQPHARGPRNATGRKLASEPLPGDADPSPGSG